MAAQKIAKIQAFKGLISAPFTAFKDNGDVNIEIIPEYVDHLVKLGVKGVFVNGTTGEGLSLTVDERKVIAEKWVDAGKSKLELIIIQVGANSVKDAKILAAHASKIGVTGIASLPPVFYKPTTNEHLIAFLKELADSAPDLPLMLYHIPSFSGIELSIGNFLPAARSFIPNFCGAKFTSIDVRDLLKCHRLPGLPYKLLSGFDEVLLPSLDCGVNAAVGATYNFMAPVTLKMIDAYEKGDRKKALELQQKVSEAVEVIVKYGQSISSLKATMNILSKMNFGSPRIPLVPLTVNEQEGLRKALGKLGASEWSKF